MGTTPSKQIAAAQEEVLSFGVSEKVYPRSVSGLFARRRWVMVVMTQIIFYCTPWLQWNNRQAVLFDLEAPHFYIFSLVLHPQDMIYLVAVMLISALMLFFFTAVAGRLWCGYACPQTVYTEIFIWIERQTEGDRQARMRLNEGPWSIERLYRKGAKHALWAFLALFTGFTFVGYFIPIRTLWHQTLGWSLDGWPIFWIMFYGAATYGNAGWLREQICKYVCAYARFQNTLMDGDSFVIAYDNPRGDPRGSRSRKSNPRDANLGDCIDCTMCVQVCPTGIDIRNGLQNECIGCAACIDVCDQVMEKMSYPKGLIRYSTGNGVALGLTRPQMLRRIIRPRVIAYGFALTAAVVLCVLGLTLRGPVMMDVIRDRGALARVSSDGQIENVYHVQLMNRLEEPSRYRIQTDGLKGLYAIQSSDWTVNPGEVQSLVLTLALPQESAAIVEPGAHPVNLMVFDANRSEPVVKERTTFVVPR